MIFSAAWGQRWVDAWNGRDLDQLMDLYGDAIQLRSPFAKLFANGGTVRGKSDLRAYWQEVMRRTPKLKLELINVYAGHDALAMHYRDERGRNVIETVLFDEHDKAVFETACLDKAR